MAKLAFHGQISGRLRPGVLLAEATSFVGRTDELRQIAALLRAARLVTLVGPGGVGKTRICQRAAVAAIDQFPDGAWLVELSGLRDPALLYPTVAAALRLADQDAPAQRAAVLNWLRDRQVLLILDTCEHLIDGCAMLVADVLRAARGVTVLATSRQPLDTPGEHAFPVPPLPLETDAVELFAQRAAAVAPAFEVTPENLADVSRLCRRLDGIPLAIELAAVRLRALPLPELADRIEAGFGVLAVSRRGTSPRHQTLRTAVEWSHGLCTAAERILWARLSVFAGAFEVAAAEEVCADDGLPREEIIHALVGLVDKSVVLRSRCEDNRYLLPDTLREFAAERLAASGEEARVLDRLTARYLRMAVYFDEHFLGDDQAETCQALHREYPGIRTALEYTIGDERPPGSAGEMLARARRGAELTVRLHAFWQISGLLGEGRHWLGKVLRLFPGHAGENSRVLSPERAWALGVNGRLATFQGDIAGALADIRESIRQADELGEELAAARGYLYLNLALAFGGQHTAALQAATTARRRMTACEYRTGLITLEPQLAYLHQLTGDTEAAIECCERGLRSLGAGSKERCITSYLTLIRAYTLFQAPDLDDECARTIRRALLAKYDLGDVVGIAYCLELLGWLAARRKWFERAAWLSGAADGLWQRNACQLAEIAALAGAREHTARAARSALGDRRYEAARAQGAGLALDAVVRRAATWPGAGTETGPETTDDAIAVGWTACAGTGAAPGPAANDRAAGPAQATATLLGVLTRREREISELVASGLSNREIATRLFISKRTVDAHVEHIFGKLEISSRVQLTILLRDQLPA